MRQVIVLCVAAALMLSGCSPVAKTSQPTVSETPSATPSTEASIGADAPADNPSLERLDADGRTPDESVLALIDALNKSDWRAAYSLYATPSVDLSTASREWADAHETHVDFRVPEVRVTDADTAWVRVTYGVSSNPLSSAMPPVIVAEPGEWWPVHKVDGVWKTQWMPRQ
jgi:uncharacterized protein YceK